MNYFIESLHASILWSMSYYHSHFKDEKNDIQRVWRTCPKSEPKQSNSTVPFLIKRHTCCLSHGVALQDGSEFFHRASSAFSLLLFCLWLKSALPAPRLPSSKEWVNHLAMVLERTDDPGKSGPCTLNWFSEGRVNFIWFICIFLPCYNKGILLGGWHGEVVWWAK